MLLEALFRRLSLRLSKRLSIAQSQRSRAILIININDNKNENIDIVISDGANITPIAEVVIKVTNLPKRIKEYIKKVSRPNIYTGIYYNDIYENYSLLTLINIFVEEWYYEYIYLYLLYLVSTNFSAGKFVYCTGPI